MNIYITRPGKEDEKELRNLFTTVITDAFSQDGIDTSANDDVKDEIEYKSLLLSKDFKSGGEEVHFLIARSKDQIIGTIAYLEADVIIMNNYDIDYECIPEIGSVFVLPEFQGKGIGSMLFKEILKELEKKNIKEFCLDSGYKKAQKFWTRKLGVPVVVLKDYWAKGADHFIWHCKVGAGY